MGVLPIRTGELQHHSRPEFVVQVKCPRAIRPTMGERPQGRKRGFIQRRCPQLAQFLTATAKGVDHAVYIHVDWIEAYVKSKTENIGGLAAAPLLPDRRVLLHQGED